MTNNVSAFQFGLEFIFVLSWSIYMYAYITTITPKCYHIQIPDLFKWQNALSHTDGTIIFAIPASMLTEYVAMAFLFSGVCFFSWVLELFFVESLWGKKSCYMSVCSKYVRCMVWTDWPFLACLFYLDSELQLPTSDI